MKAFELKVSFAVAPQELYNAWLDSKIHSAMTGSEADCNRELGVSFSAWDGYITGTNLTLMEGMKIVQRWRTLEFNDKDRDSNLTLRFEAAEGGCLLTLVHTHIPAGQPDYAKGWEEYYFDPMRVYFRKR